MNSHANCLVNDDLSFSIFFQFSMKYCKTIKNLFHIINHLRFNEISLRAINHMHGLFCHVYHILLNVTHIQSLFSFILFWIRFIKYYFGKKYYFVHLRLDGYFFPFYFCGTLPYGNISNLGTVQNISNINKISNFVY